LTLSAIFTVVLEGERVREEDHEPQAMRPQWRQWWRRSEVEKASPQIWHAAARWSGSHGGGAEMACRRARRCSALIGRPPRSAASEGPECESGQRPSASGTFGDAPAATSERARPKWPA